MSGVVDGTWGENSLLALVPFCSSPLLPSAVAPSFFSPLSFFVYHHFSPCLTPCTPGVKGVGASCTQKGQGAPYFLHNLQVVDTGGLEVTILVLIAIVVLVVVFDSGMLEHNLGSHN